MKDSAIFGAIIGKRTISGIQHFRYGQQMGETRLFEFSCKPQQVDADVHEGQLITLIVPGALGKSKELQGIITKIDYQQSPGYGAEVFVTGSVDAPSGNSTRFFGFMAAVILFPLLLAGYFLLRANSLEQQLVSQTGVLAYVHQHPAKGAHIYTFKLKEYPAVFYRRYEHMPVNLGWPDIKAITGNDFDDFDKDDTIHRVQLKMLLTDQDKLGNSNARLLFFNIRPAGQGPTNTLRYDLLEYVLNTWNGFLIRMLALFIGAALYFGVYYHYKNLKPNGSLKYSIPYWGGMGVALLFYLIIVLF